MRSRIISPRSCPSRSSVSGPSRWRPFPSENNVAPAPRSDMTDRVRIAAHAKINLFLRILARETSGYHQIETAFTLLELADELVVTRSAQGVDLQVDGPDLGPAEENLAVRAARAVLEATGRKFGVRIELTKRIPTRAGLGGGSSDAAAAL